MNEIASLGYSIDSRPLATAVGWLDAMARSAGLADVALQQLGGVRPDAAQAAWAGTARALDQVAAAARTAATAGQALRQSFRAAQASTAGFQTQVGLLDNARLDRLRGEIAQTANAWDRLHAAQATVPVRPALPTASTPTPPSRPTARSHLPSESTPAPLAAPRPAASRADPYLALQRTLDPTTAAAARLAQTEALLTERFRAGGIAADQHARLVDRARAAYRDALDPIGAFNARLEAEARAAAGGSRARGDLIAGLQAEQRLRRSGVSLTEDEAQALRERVAQVRAAAREADAVQKQAQAAAVRQAREAQAAQREAERAAAADAQRAARDAQRAQLQLERDAQREAQRIARENARAAQLTQAQAHREALAAAREAARAQVQAQREAARGGTVERAIVRTVDPSAGAAQKLAETEAVLTQRLQAGSLAAEQHARLIERARAAYAGAIDPMGAFNARLNAEAQAATQGSRARADLVAGLTAEQRLRRAGVDLSATEAQALRDRVAAVRTAAREADAAQRAAARSADQLTGAWGGMATAALALGGALAVRQIYQYTEGWTRARNAVAQYTDTASEQAAVMDRLFALAQGSGQAFGAVVDSYQRVAISGDALGASQADLIAVTGAAAAGLAIMGESGPAASEAMRQFGQALGSPTVQAEEFNSLMDSMTPLMDAVAKQILGTGGTIAGLKAMVNDQKLSNTNFFQALLDVSGEMQARLAEATPTIGRALTSIDNALGRYVGQADQATGISTALARQMMGLAQNIDVAAAAAAGLVASGLALYLPTVARGIQAVGLAIARTPLGALAVVAAGVTTAMTVLRDEITLFGADAERASRQAADGFAGMEVTVGDGLRAIGSYLQQADDALGRWQEGWASATDGAMGSLGGLTGYWAQVADVMRGQVNDTIGLFAGMAEVIPDLFASLPAQLGDVFARALNAVAEQVESEVNRIIRLMNTIPAALSLPTVPEVQLPRAANPFAAEAGAARADAAERMRAARARDYVGEAANDFRTRAEFYAARRQADQPTASGVDLAAPPPARPTVPGMDPAAAKAAASAAKAAAREAGQAAEEMARALAGLQDRLDPIGRAQRDLAEQTGVLDAALRRGAIGAGEHADLMGRLRDEMADALNPMAAYVQAAMQEAAAAGMDATARADLADAIADETRLRQAGVAFTEAESEAFRAAAVARAAANRAAEEALSTAQNTARSLADEVQAQRDHNAEIGLSTGALAELNRVRQQGLLLTEQAALATELAANGETALTAALRESIAQRQELIALNASGARLQAEADAARAAEEDWARTAQAIEQGLTDALMRGFESGKGFGENLRDTLENMFRTLVLKPIIEPILKDASQAISGMLGGLGRTSRVPGAAMAGAGGGGGFGGLGGLGNLASLFGGGGASVGGMLYGAALPGIAAGSQQAAMLAAQTGGFGAAGLTSTMGAAGGMQNWMSGAGSSLMAAGGMFLGTGLASKIGGYDDDQANYAAIGAAIGNAVVPGLGGLVGGVLGGLAGGFLDPGDAERRGTFQQGQRGASPTYSGSSALGQFGIVNDKWFSDSEMGGAFRGFLDGLKQLDNQLAATLDRDELGRVQESLRNVRTEAGFGMEHTDVGASGAFGGLALQRYRAAFEAINPPLARFLANFQGTGDELGAMVGSLTSLNAAMKAGRAEIGEQKSAWEQWEDMARQTRTALAGFDDSLPALQNIVAMNQTRYAMEAELIRGITDSIASQRDAFDASIRDIRYAAFDDTGKATYLRDEANASFAELAGATDPEQINALGSELRELIQQSYQLVGPEAQRELSEYFVSDLNRVGALVAERLSAARESVRDASDPDAPGSIAAAIEAALNRSAGGFQRASDVLQQSAATMLAAAQTPVTVRIQSVRAGSEVGG